MTLGYNEAIFPTLKLGGAVLAGILSGISVTQVKNLSTRLNRPTPG